MALSGDTAVVGARYAQVGGVYATGAAYVFTRSEGVWAQQAKLTAGADADMDDLFGLAVALDGDTALVSAFADVDGRYDTGAVYVFVRTGESWTRSQRLTASDLDHNELFGWSVALQGATAVVGAPGYLTDADPLKTGDAYVFERTGGTWVERQKLTASDGVAGAFFGAAAALDDARLLIGAPHRDDDAGAVYAFRRVDGVWTEEARLVSGTAPQAYLGHVLGLRGTTAVVGAPYDDPGGVTGAGSALVFTHATAGWTPGPTLVAPDGAPGDAFGSSVGLGGGLALIGAHAADVGGLVDSGAAYVFWVADIAARAQEVVDVLDAAVAAGTLVGSGPGKSAEHRLGAVRRMLLGALDLIEQGDTAGACAELSSASSRIHPGGPLRPSHFVTGEAAYDLQQRILDLMEALGCG